MWTTRSGDGPNHLGLWAKTSGHGRPGRLRRWLGRRRRGARRLARAAGEPWLTAAIPVENPYCSCRLTEWCCSCCGRTRQTTWPAASEHCPHVSLPFLAFLTAVPRVSPPVLAFLAVFYCDLTAVPCVSYRLTLPKTAATTGGLTVFLDPTPAASSLSGPLRPASAFEFSLTLPTSGDWGRCHWWSSIIAT